MAGYSEQAAEAIRERYPSFDPITASGIAHTLAEAGFLTPAPLREEWATLDRAGERQMWGGVRWTARDEDHAREKAHAFGYEVHRRYVSDWEIA
ncbi:hypothetical protein G6009_00865 [Dietzia sp. SLG510A3-30A2]|nr:hypothetical protein [Dietzia sp. SLG510A3-30A2]